MADSAATERFIVEQAPSLIEFVVRLCIGITILVVVVRCSGTLRRCILRQINRHIKHDDETLINFFSVVAINLMRLGAFILVTTILKIDTSMFAAAIAAAMFAVGLACVGAFTEFTCGIAILTTRPFTLGDSIAVGHEQGIVREIGLCKTTVDTFDNRRVVVSNSTLYHHPIVNLFKHQMRRIDIELRVTHEADTERTREALSNAAALDEPTPEKTESVETLTSRGKSKTLDLTSISGLAAELPPVPSPGVFLSSVAETGPEWKIMVWMHVKTMAEYLRGRDRLLEAVKRELDKASIQIAATRVELAMAPSAGLRLSTLEWEKSM